MDLSEADLELRRVVSRIPLGDRAYLLDLLTAADGARAAAIGKIYASGLAPATVEVPIDAEEDRTIRSLVVGLLRESSDRAPDLG